MPKSSKLMRLGAKSTAVAATLAVLGAASATSAFAAGTGYGPSINPGTPAGGGFSQVVLSKTVPTSGGTFTATSKGDTYSFNTLPGTFQVPVQVTVEAPTDISAVHGVAGVEIGFYSTSGIPLPPASLAKPITVTVVNPAIKAGDAVEMFEGGKYVAYTGRASVANGSAAISVTSDPVFAIVPPPAKTTTVPAASTSTPSTPSSSTPAASKVVPGATSAHTGKPFLGEELAAGVAALIGAGGLAEALRRRRRAAA